MCGCSSSDREAAMAEAAVDPLHAAVGRLSRIWTLSPEQRAEYREALADLPSELVDDAVGETIREWKWLRPPPPGEVRQRAIALRKDRTPKMRTVVVFEPIEPCPEYPRGAVKRYLDRVPVE
jgi:hypothetical protein